VAESGVGVAGARRTLDADGVLDGGADQFVLVGLDGGHDVAHGSDAGRSISLVRIRLAVPSSSPRSRCSSSNEVSVPVENPNRRRIATPWGSPAEAR
jgi:hypothetical protein